MLTTVNWKLTKLYNKWIKVKLSEDKRKNSDQKGAQNTALNAVNLYYRLSNKSALDQYQPFSLLTDIRVSGW